MRYDGNREERRDSRGVKAEAIGTKMPPGSGPLGSSHRGKDRLPRTLGEVRAASLLLGI